MPTRRRVLTLAAFAATAAAVFARPRPNPAHDADLMERMLPLPDGPRPYVELVPTSLRPNAPLVVLLHGGTQSMWENFDGKAGGSARWAVIARREGFVLVAPNGSSQRTGSPLGTNQNWNDMRALGSEAFRRIDDVGFVAALIDRMAKQHGIDRSRVYVTGASNGGMMTYRLLLDRPELFAAGVAFIANLPVGGIKSPARPTPIMIVNGTKDPLMPDGGGTVGFDRGDVRSTEATVDFWRQVNGASETGDTTDLPDASPGDGCRLFRTDWPGAAPVALIRADGGGHQVPDPETPVRSWFGNRLLGPVCRDAAGADLAWDFMRRFTR